jgi:hypothetical protein
VGKISTEARRRYFERVKEYKGAIDHILQREANVLQAMKSDEKGGDHKRLTLADENLNLVSYHILMNSLSVTLLGVKNEAFLNDARKGCYKSIIYLEETVTPFIDVPFSDYEEHLSHIDGFDDAQRYRLVRKLGYSIQAVADEFGENSKWKWSFVELEGRFATVAKNLLNLKTFVTGMDPRVPGYETRIAHLNLAKRLLQQAADRYRQKYELSTLRIDDFKLAISYLSALRRLNMVLGHGEEADELRKKIEIWRAKMETDSRRHEQAGKEDRAQKK